MPLISPYQGPLIKLRLARDLVRTIKRGHPWVYADALRQRPAAPAGAHAVLTHKKQKRTIARGFYDPRSPLAFRVCTVEPNQLLDDTWATKRMERAVRLRQTLFDKQTTGYRLFNGEGDGLPGLICDIYGRGAVLQFDGAGPGNFWHQQGVAEWLAQTLSIEFGYLHGQSRHRGKGQLLLGDLSTDPIHFRENGVRFTVDVVHGQKTGFFLDQRENRQHIRAVAANRHVLNIFGYTGGFSVYAGLGGATQVTTVDVAAPALDAAGHHWQLNGLEAANHRTVQQDAFEFLAQAIRDKRSWGLVIVDPPSFASAKETVSRALSTYERLMAAAATVTTPDGLLAVASCSSHVDMPTFLGACEAAIAQARRRATILRISGQPPDHPSPLPFSEFRYLKFVLMQVE
jgi:23S rRNA (cytosine1962-C5)-methyltransferase